MKTTTILTVPAVYAGLFFFILALAACKKDGPPPVADFTATPNIAVVGQSIQFTDQSSDNPASWLWTFGDGTTDTRQNPSKSYTAAGYYTVSLKASNSHGDHTKTIVNCITVIDGGGPGSVTDIDGNVYTTVTIGTQTWMVENLKTTRYSDGTSIPNVTDASAWFALSTPGYCWYNNDINNKAAYGALYNWYTVNTGKLAPAGWHVATDAEWKTLEMALGMTQAQADSTGYRGTDQGTKLRDTGGFKAIPGGSRVFNGEFRYLTQFAYWWTATENSAANAWNRNMYFTFTNVYRLGFSKQWGFSVRCVKNN